jgi:hypothetical protein
MELSFSIQLFLSTANYQRIKLMKNIELFTKNSPMKFIEARIPE